MTRSQAIDIFGFIGLIVSDFVLFILTSLASFVK